MAGLKIIVPGFAVLIAVLYKYSDILSGFSEHNSLGNVGMQAALTSFCVTGAYTTLVDETKNPLGDDHVDPMIKGEKRDFQKTGEVREDEYTKNSIYSLLYASYRNAGVVKDPNGRCARANPTRDPRRGPSDGAPSRGLRGDAEAGASQSRASHVGCEPRRELESGSRARCQLPCSPCHVATDGPQTELHLHFHPPGQALPLHLQHLGFLQPQRA